MNIPLPTATAKLSELIGSDGTIALIEYARQGDGKRHIYVPLRPKPGNNLVQLIGMEAAAKLAKEFGGQVIELPKYKAIDRAQRDQQVKNMAAAGLTLKKIAKTFGLTVRQIQNLVRSHC